MKNIYNYLLIFSFMILFSTSEIVAQSFYTGSIGISQTDGGRTRVYSDDLTTQLINRISILVGVSSTSVFDYNEDQDVLIAAATVSSPISSDFEITSTINNAYSNLPPNVITHYNIYGWTNGSYLLVKANVKNNEASAISAVIGLEAIPRVDGTYELDTLQWDADAQMMLVNEDLWAGVKFLSSAQTSLRLIDWTDPYANDSLYYVWLNQDSFDSPLISNADAAVAVLGQSPVEIQAGDSVDFYYGISLGSDKASCIANMSDCESKYFVFVPVELSSFTALCKGNQVTLNWTTATELNNQGFEIQRSISGSDWATIAFKNGAGSTTNPQSYSYVDQVTSVKEGKVLYRLKQIDFGGEYKYSSVVEVKLNEIPISFSLDQNYPNPFNPSTKISFGLPQRSNVVLKIFNTLGQEVAELVNESLDAGMHTYNFDASKLSSGIYVYSLKTDAGIISKKMTLIK